MTDNNEAYDGLSVFTYNRPQVEKLTKENCDGKKKNVLQILGVS